MRAITARVLLVALSAASVCASGSLSVAHAAGPGAEARGRDVSGAGSSAGATDWARRYDGPAASDDGATSVAVSGDGLRVFVTGGATGSASGYDYATIAYRASTGRRLWAQAYDGPGNGFDQATAIAVSPSGSDVFVTGASRGSGTKLDYATVAYDAASGAPLWVKRYNGSANGIDYATALGVSADGSAVFVTGYSRGAGSGDDYVTVAYRASTGAMLWQQRYDGPGHASDEARALAVSGDGAMVIVSGGSARAADDTDFVTIAYSATTGARLWLKRYDPTGHGSDQAHGLRVSPDSATVFVTGESIGSDGGWDYATLAYDTSDGHRRWLARYQGTAQRDDYATALALSPDGSALFVTGYSIGTTNRFDYATIAYDTSDGSPSWVRRYDGPAHDTDDANAVVVSPDGLTVVVTGASIGTTGSADYATLAYRTADGHRRWLDRYDGPGGGEDYAYGLAMAPAGVAVYVTGESTGATSALDDATLAYRLH